VPRVNLYQYPGSQADVAGTYLAVDTGFVATTQKRRLSPQFRRALELRAAGPHGVTEELLVCSHGSNERMLARYRPRRSCNSATKRILAGDCSARSRSRQYRRREGRIIEA
jgi:hypothetical protein